MRVAFPLIYVAFGRIVQPFTYRFYVESVSELLAPGWNLVIPVQLGRSAILLLMSLMVLLSWTLYRRSLFARLGGAIFVLIGLVWTVTSYCMNPTLPFLHCLEILADSVVYSGLFVWLFTQPKDLCD